MEYELNGKTYLIPEDSRVGQAISRYAHGLLFWHHVMRYVRVYLVFMAIFAIIVALTPLTWSWLLSSLVVLALAFYFYAKDRLVSLMNQDFWVKTLKGDWVLKE